MKQDIQNSTNVKCKWPSKRARPAKTTIQFFIARAYSLRTQSTKKTYITFTCRCGTKGARTAKKNRMQFPGLMSEIVLSPADIANWSLAGKLVSMSLDLFLHRWMLYGMASAIRYSCFQRGLWIYLRSPEAARFSMKSPIASSTLRYTTQPTISTLVIATICCHAFGSSDQHYIP